MTVDRHYDWEKYSWTCSRVFLTTVGPGGPHIIAIWQVHTSPYKSIQVHPAVAGQLITANQRVPKTPHGRTVMPTRPDPPVAAPWRRSLGADGPVAVLPSLRPGLS